jgi:hypothetical protein
MRLGIMQPYFLPYIGYWQLMNAVDKFVVYDNVQFIKKGWINRNRILLNAKEFSIKIPIKSDSYSLDINERSISDRYFDKDVHELVRTIRYSYRKAPYFNTVMPIMEKCFLFEEKKLSNFILNSIKIISEYLEIATEIILSSKIKVGHFLKGQERIIGICKNLSATSYVNPIGGLKLYDSKLFESNGIELRFLESTINEYKQFCNEFVPNLSIIDVMMFNSKDDIKKMLDKYELIKSGCLRNQTIPTIG